MPKRYSHTVAPFVRSELERARHATQDGRPTDAFRHLERAHVLGQASTYWHVVVHVAMLRWGMRTANVREVVGQVFRVIGAATKTFVGWVPQGNTGGADVSPFRPMPIASDLAVLIDRARAEAAGRRY